MIIRNCTIAAALAVGLAGCAAQKVWMKPGAGMEEFNQAKYACLQQGQQPYSTAYVNRYGGTASGGMATNPALYSACMEAGGWALVDNAQSGSPEYAATIKGINEDGRALCRKPEYYAYYSWAPCAVREVSAEQLNDRAHVTAAEKPVYEKVKAEQDDLTARIIATHRQYNEKNGEAFARNIEQAKAMSDIVRQEYLTGKISRGEHNRRRRDIAVSSDTEALRIMRGT
ncbi:hypothetical protein E4K66_30370 [Bradyrhizobium frederickii]|uniref:DUF2799 domain-containing protein n=1 Tax=Bradyrhizobium frederickii TaxID=2560054 RepID=A0A4Y9KXQ0_9BRAD|nr:hypothetical protein [Bradyrhizobium frederickii]TFV34704.1 hypothetical protein E4K66_30370 [Bradyrhizobium frederickii]